MQWWIKICFLTYFFRFTSWANWDNIRRSRHQYAAWSNKLQNKIITWPDSLANDYIHRPIDNKLDQICFCDMTICYKKGFNAFQKFDVNDEETNTYIQGGVKKHKFKENHPGDKFSHLIQLKISIYTQDCIAEGKAMSSKWTWSKVY